MSIFQYIGIGFVAVLAMATLRNILRHRSKLSISIMWLLIWCAAGAAILTPDSMTVIARILGIERGADLVFYCAVLGGLVGFFLMYIRIREINRQMTLLVRQIALLNAVEPEKSRIDRPATTGTSEE